MKYIVFPEKLVQNWPRFEKIEGNNFERIETVWFCFVVYLEHIVMEEEEKESVLEMKLNSNVI